MLSSIVLLHRYHYFPHYVYCCLCLRHHLFLHIFDIICYLNIVLLCVESQLIDMPGFWREAAPLFRTEKLQDDVWLKIEF